jgi:hypothetical protein
MIRQAFASKGRQALTQLHTQHLMTEPRESARRLAGAATNLEDAT